MTKFLPYPRRELRRRQMRWAKSNAVLVLVVTGGMVAVLAVVTLLFSLGTTTSLNSYALGVVHAVVVASFLFLLHTAFLAHDREAIWHLRGAWGEENTRNELRRARRKRLIWGHVDSISLQAGDLDHLVVTRHGGLIALDSKWRSRHDATDTLDMVRAASKVRLRAEGLTQTLLKSDRGARHRARTNPLSVKPAVVLWGAAQHAVPHGAQVDGIEFVAGRQLRRWLAQLEGESVTKEAAEDILKRLNKYRAASWEIAGTSNR